jgi:hypothetical protein
MSLRIPRRFFYACYNYLKPLPYLTERTNNESEAYTALAAVALNDNFYIKKERLTKRVVFLNSLRWITRLWIRVSFQQSSRSVKADYIHNYLTVNIVKPLAPDVELGKDTLLHDKIIGKRLNILRDIKRKYRFHEDLLTTIKELSKNLKSLKTNNLKTACYYKYKPDYTLEPLTREMETLEKVLSAEDPRLVSARQTKKYVVPIPTHQTAGATLKSETTKHDLLIRCKEDRTDATTSVTAPRILFEKAHWVYNYTRDNTDKVTASSRKDKIERTILELNFSITSVNTVLDLLYGLKPNINPTYYPEIYSLSLYLGAPQLINQIEKLISNHIEQSCTNSNFKLALDWSSEEYLEEWGLPPNTRIQEKCGEILAKVNVSYNSGFNINNYKSAHLCALNYLASPSNPRAETTRLEDAFQWCFNKATERLARSKERDNLFKKVDENDDQKGKTRRTVLPVAIDPFPDSEVYMEAIRLFKTPIQDTYPRSFSDCIEIEYVRSFMCLNDHFLGKVTPKNLFSEEQLTEAEKYSAGEISQWDLSRNKIPGKKDNYGFNRIKETDEEIEYHLWFDKYKLIEELNNINANISSAPFTTTFGNESRTCTFKIVKQDLSMSGLADVYHVQLVFNTPIQSIKYEVQNYSDALLKTDSGVPSSNTVSLVTFQNDYNNNVRNRTCLKIKIKKI